MTDSHLDPALKHDIVLLYDATDSNPNGDPDAGNRPRTDEETNIGLVTDVALKRKIRDTVALAAGDLGLPTDRYDLFVQAGHVLDDQVRAVVPDIDTELPAKKTLEPEAIDNAHRALCERYVDIRLFGAVLTAGNGRLGHIRGPLQVGFSRSIHRVLPVDHAITRVSASSKERAEERNVRTEMGGKWTVAYGLYRVSMHYSAPLGGKTGVTTDDLRVLYHTITHMFEHTRSAARPDMNVRGLYAFSHDNGFGRAPAHELDQLVRIEAKPGPTVPRGFDDYAIDVDMTEVPDGVTLTRLIG